MSLNLKFADSLPEAINVIVYLEFDNLIEIDKENQVITDYI